ncbi:MAG: O-antigen ligase family protein, partial [Bacteroidetes bacterium]|nr:O-antigen ligase family protein [Bacteroidota bacterium]
MNRTLFFSRCYFILIGISVLSVPFTSLLYFFTTPLLLIVWIIEGDWKTKWNRLKEPNTLIIIFAFVLFWFINVIGLFYSNDIVRGLMRTYDKLPFLVYPLVFFTLDKAFFTKEKLYHLFKAFLCVTVIMLLICWGNAIIQFLITKNPHCFYYIYFSKFFGHPSYCVCIVCIAFCVAFYFLNHAKKNRWLWVILLFFYSISIYFFQSRSGVFAYIVILILSLFFYLNNHKKEYGRVAVLFSTVLLIAVMLIKFFPFRVGEYANIDHFQDKSFAEEIFETRYDIWQISYKLAMKNKMWGIGTGYNNECYLSDTDAELINIHTAFINTHNQFLQTFLDHGIFGLFAIVFLVLYSFYYA